MNIYWATTEDHDEDWFIIAENEQEAAKLHEEMEGYNPGDAVAEFVLTVPENISPPPEPGWPSNELLKDCGAEFLSDEPARVVKIGDRKFSEGLMELQVRQIDDERFDKMGMDRPNETPPLQKPDEYS